MSVHLLSASSARKKDKGEPKRKWYADIAFTPEPLKSFDNPACRFKQEYQLLKDALEADYSINF